MGEQPIRAASGLDACVGVGETFFQTNIRRREKFLVTEIPGLESGSGPILFHLEAVVEGAEIFEDVIKLGRLRSGLNVILLRFLFPHCCWAIPFAHTRQLLTYTRSSRHIYGFSVICDPVPLFETIPRSEALGWIRRIVG